MVKFATNLMRCVREFPDFISQGRHDNTILDKAPPPNTKHFRALKVFNFGTPRTSQSIPGQFNRSVDDKALKL